VSRASEIIPFCFYCRPKRNADIQIIDNRGPVREDAMLQAVIPYAMPKNAALGCLHLYKTENGSFSISEIQFSKRRRFEYALGMHGAKSIAKACESHSAGEY
jgi:hypothetical protein